jgi:hypothetical protein
MRSVAHKQLCGLMAATLIGSVVFATVRAIPAQIEEPSTVSAAAILGSPLRGPNYEIANAVRSDGFLYIFSLNTNYGRYQIEGRDMLKMRLRELGAIAALEQMNKSQAYIDAAEKAAMKPVNLAAGLCHKSHRLR